MKRKAQASGAASLIGILTLIFIFYIIFLPPETTRELLEENITGTTTSVAKQTLLSESPGRLSYIEQEKFNHPLPNIVLVETRQAAILATENPFTVSKGWFGEDKKTMYFTITDLQNTENLILSFQAPTRKGTLNIVLNSVPIFQSKIDIQNPKPIALPKNLLKETNTLEFSTTGGFFEGKKYSLQDIKVIGDITDITQQQATNTFKISDTEYQNIETSYLDFYPICDQSSAGVITIALNGRTLYSAMPSCNSNNRQEIFKDDLMAGKNTLAFTIQKGAYRIEDITIKDTVTPTKAYIDYFNVGSKVYEQVDEGTADIILKIEFTDTESYKEAEININGVKDVISQRELKFERDISNVIKEGNNYIEILPLTDISIPRLEIRVE